MGIEEYQFLTKTMEQIESDSISLDEVKNDLKKLDKRISKMDDKSRHNWDEFNSFKKTMEKENEKLTDLEIIEESSDPELPESKLRTEIKTLRNSRKTKLDFLAGGIASWCVPWHGSTSQKFGFSPIPEVVKAEGQIDKLKASSDFKIQWATDEKYNRKKVLENWDFGSIVIPWYLYFWMPFMVVVSIIGAGYYVAFDGGNYLAICYDEQGNISNEEEVYFTEVNDGEVHCTYGGDERALNASEQEQLEEIEKRESWFVGSSMAMICLGPILIPLLSVIYLRPKLEQVVELDLQIDDLQSKLSVINEEERRRKKYESDLNSVPQREAENAAHDQSLATERGKRDSMRVDIEDLEAKIQGLWESINHLIPYSSELDKN